MQYHAIENDRLIFVKDAERKKNYQCPECSGTVRLRQGYLRRAHFYHPRSSSCALSRKGAVHIAIQEKLHRELPGSSMEHRFPTINRIADVYWPKQRLVLEVQYSPISITEARQRIDDYEKIGLKIIWILHVKRFNKRFVAKAERLLRSRCCYFTDINASGQGIIFDQWDQLRGLYRIRKGPPLKVLISKPLECSFSEELPSVLKEKIDKNSLYFSGDIIDRQSQRGWNQFIRSQEIPLTWTTFFKKIQRGYLILFRTLAEILVSS